MELKSIRIKNFRSIEDISLNFRRLEDNSYTYGLIGINEAGKSSILKALGLRDEVVELKPKDFRDKSKPIEICFEYEPLEVNPEQILGYPVSVYAPALEVLSNCQRFIYKFTFTYDNPITHSWTVSGLKHDGDASEEFEIENMPEELYVEAIFWTADSKYLISEPINLTNFANKPSSSIPLKNCFLLAGIENIKDRINSLADDSTEIEFLQKNLGQKVTEHIRTVWPNHPIEISFQITNGAINFHIHDLEGDGKAKTADQRSDGFKQFVSFLLTISAQNKNQELKNTLLLLDEPETHIHPKAQEFLLDELIKITQGDKNNIVLYATHSNYMIDKKDLSRNLRIRKINDRTTKEDLSKKESTYASVTFDVFEIPNSDYHNELYGKIHQLYQDEDSSDDKRERIKDFDEKFLSKKFGLKQIRPWKGNPNSATLPTYIRNCIHHPDNGDKYSEKDLAESINLLIKILNV